MADTPKPTTTDTPTPRIDDVDPEDGPSSNETCGQFPYDEVLATYADPPPPEGDATRRKA